MDSHSAERPYTDFKSWSIARYGEALFRIPVDLDVPCPHRTKTGQGGCTFCPETGARARQSTTQQDTLVQLRAGVDFARKRYRAKSFALYLQNYTPTAQPTASFIRQLTPLLEACPFKAVYIGTRPDTLSDSLLAYLTKLNEDLDVFMELGVQSTSDTILRAMNRGHTWADSAKCLERMEQAGLHSVVHLILGWPGQNHAQARLDLRRLHAFSITGIKFHNLHVLKHSALAQQVQTKPIELPEPYAYGELLMDLLRHIPDSWVPMRLITDSIPEERLAPDWPITKGEFLAHIDRHMKWRGWRQGDLVHSRTSSIPPPEMLAVPTKDGTCTAWNADFKEHYHAPQGALLESCEKYVYPARLDTLFQSANQVRILDICFGLGYNTLAAWQTAREANNNIHITALEVDRIRLLASIHFLPNQLRHIAQCLCRSGRYHEGDSSIHILWGDARHTAPQLQAASFDRIFLDPFSTQRNSELWTVEFFQMLAGLIQPEGLLLTYSTAGPVLAGLKEAGFHSGPGQPGTRYTGIMAAKRLSVIRQPWSEEEWNQRVSGSRAIPYRDSTGWMSNSQILNLREQQVKQFKGHHGN